MTAPEKTDDELLAEALARSMDPSEQKSIYIRDLVKQQAGGGARSRLAATGTAQAPATIPNIPGAIFTGNIYLEDACHSIPYEQCLQNTIEKL